MIDARPRLTAYLSTSPTRACWPLVIWHMRCPDKGVGSNYDVVGGSSAADLAASAWYYPEPDEAVSAVAGRVAFCADRLYINVE